ncbi:kazal domain protein [Chryseolinea soli]|uniref:Kazal domain protein n=1 Tax=Chryseolinea soli TaxID=2321403 RepID=A0A385SPE2_9BACT|nr:kazal domain protein [Chryseolinea soli]AYB31815.1 kazal domain protein [Chryseolinea soli]
MQKTKPASWTSLLTVVLVLFVSFTLSVCSSSSVVQTDNDGCIDPAKIDLNGTCMTLYAPVCGCNNVTYGNECLATRSGVLHWKEGKCK